MRRVLLSLMVAVLLNSSLAQAECRCIWEGPFTRVQGQTSTVAAVEVISSSGNSVDLAVEQVLRGDEFRNPVRLWLDTGSLCRPAVDTFAVGSRWVMALNRIEELPQSGFNPHTPNISFGRIDDYSLSRCGGYWLSLTEDRVSGNLTAGPRWDMDPRMSPILLALVADYVSGELSLEALKEAGKLDPALQQLRIDTRAFLRAQNRSNPVTADDWETDE